MAMFGSAMPAGYGSSNPFNLPQDDSYARAQAFARLLTAQQSPTPGGLIGGAAPRSAGGPSSPFGVPTVDASMGQPSAPPPVQPGVSAFGVPTVDPNMGKPAPVMQPSPMDTNAMVQKPPGLFGGAAPQKKVNWFKSLLGGGPNGNVLGMDRNDLLQAGLKTWQQGLEGGHPGAALGNFADAFGSTQKRQKFNAYIDTLDLSPEEKARALADPQGFLKMRADAEAARAKPVDGFVWNADRGWEKPAGPQIYNTPDGLVEAQPGVDPKLVYGAHKEPPLPKWETRVVGDRVIAYNPQDVSQRRDMGPAPVGSGSGGGYDPSAPKLDDDAIDLAGTDYAFTGKMPTLGGRAIGTEMKTSIMNRAAHIAKDLGMSPHELLAARSDFKAHQTVLNKVRQQQANLESYEQTFLKGLNLASDYMDKVGNTDSPTWNKMINAGKKQILGDPNVAALDTTINTVAGEYAKIMSGGVGSNAASSVASMQHAHDVLYSSQSPAQFRENLKVLSQEAEFRRQSIQDTIEGALIHLGASPAQADAASATPHSPAVVDKAQAGADFMAKTFGYAPAPPAPAPAQAAPQGQFTVRAPDGSMHVFPSQQAADAFKQAAGIQ